MPDKNHSDRRPNILFICVDQWRADALSLAGHPVAETPHLDRLARDGINFTQAYASTPTCVPARATIFTGLSPRHTGFVGYNDRIDWRYDATMPGLLADAGYHTQCVGKMHTHPSRNLMGFHNVILHDGYLHRERAKRDDYGLVDDYTPWLREHLGPQADYIDTGVGCNGYAARPWVYDEMLHPTSWVTTQSIDFVRRRDPTKPFFLMMSYHRPHRLWTRRKPFSTVTAPRTCPSRSWGTGPRPIRRYAVWTAPCLQTRPNGTMPAGPITLRSATSTTS